MAEEVLVKESLTREMIAAGERLARHLANNPSLQVDALLWLYSPESNTWRFVVATPEVKSNGPKSVYEKIRLLINQLPDDGDESVAWDDLLVVDSTDSLILLLRQAIKTGDQIAGIRFSRNVVNGVLIDDAYIYKVV